MNRKQDATALCPRRILIVDDESQVAEVLDLYIRGAGFQSRIAGNVDEALKLAEREDFDLILLDVVLPGRTGFSAIQALKKKCNAAIFMMTGYAAEDIRKDAELLGASGVIQKPVDFNVLLKIIRGLKPRREICDPMSKSGELAGR